MRKCHTKKKERRATNGSFAFKYISHHHNFHPHNFPMRYKKASFQLFEIFLRRQERETKMRWRLSVWGKVIVGGGRNIIILISEWGRSEVERDHNCAKSREREHYVFSQKLRWHWKGRRWWCLTVLHASIAITSPEHRILICL